MTAYTVERRIEDVEFDEEHVEEIERGIRKGLIDEGHDQPPESMVEARLQNQLTELAKDMTLQEQGDNRLHLDIEHGEPDEE